MWIVVDLPRDPDGPEDGDNGCMSRLNLGKPVGCDEDCSLACSLDSRGDREGEGLFTEVWFANVVTGATGVASAGVKDDGGDRPSVDGVGVEVVCDLGIAVG